MVFCFCLKYQISSYQSLFSASLCYLRSQNRDILILISQIYDFPDFFLSWSLRLIAWAEHLLDMTPEIHSIWLVWYLIKLPGFPQPPHSSFRRPLIIWRAFSSVLALCRLSVCSHGKLMGYIDIHSFSLRYVATHDKKYF